MKNRRSVLLSLCLLSSFSIKAFASVDEAMLVDFLQQNVDKEVELEQDYNEIKNQWFEEKPLSIRLQDRIKNLSPKRVPRLIHVLWNEQALREEKLTEPFVDLYEYLDGSFDNLSIKDRVHFIFTGLNTDAPKKIKKELKRELYSIMSSNDLAPDEVMSILSEYQGKGLSLIKGMSFRLRYNKESVELLDASNPLKKYPTKNELKSLVDFQPDLTRFKKGMYKDSISTFLFCRTDRNYPCRMVLKDSTGNLVLKEDGTVWTEAKLARSAGNIPYNQASGNTPTGIYTMDSVMPVADTQISYGKFRRVILNFIKPQKAGQLNQTDLMPPALKAYPWWKQAMVARDIGRDLLRIHGTGRTNLNPLSAWYPFIPSNGCVKSREGTYKGVTYTDQRQLLDLMMESLGLEATFKNETKIRGLLYVIEIDNQKKAVEVEDLNGIIN